jgi:hypothetical protein
VGHRAAAVRMKGSPFPSFRGARGERPAEPPGNGPVCGGLIFVLLCMCGRSVSVLSMCGRCP